MLNLVLFLFLCVSVSADELRVVCIGVEPELLHEGKLDLYAQDAKFMAKAFESGGAVKRGVDAISLLSGADATRPKVLQKITELSKLSKESDTSVFFFSTHGDIDRKGKFYFTLAPEVKGKTWGAMTGIEFNKAISKIKGKLVVLLDTCCAEGLIKEKVSNKVSYIVASKVDESSYGQEEVATLPHGYFVIASCEALGGLADMNDDQKVSLLEFRSYVSKRSKQLELAQTTVSSIVPQQNTLSLSLVPRNAKPALILGQKDARNPFGCKDVVDRDNSLKSLAKQMGVGLVLDQKMPLFEGDWEGKWNSDGENNWSSGLAWIEKKDKSLFILYKEKGASYIFELRAFKKQIIAGYYMNLDDPQDTGPWIGKLDEDAIKGRWSGGNWNFQRGK